MVTPALLVTGCPSLPPLVKTSLKNCLWSSWICFSLTFPPSVYLHRSTDLFQNFMSDSEITWWSSSYLTIHDSTWLTIPFQKRSSLSASPLPPHSDCKYQHVSGLHCWPSSKSFLWVSSSNCMAADNLLYSEDFRTHSSVDDLNKHKTGLLILPLPARIYFLALHYNLWSPLPFLACIKKPLKIPASASFLVASLHLLKASGSGTVFLYPELRNPPAIIASWHCL